MRSLANGKNERNIFVCSVFALVLLAVVSARAELPLVDIKLGDASVQTSGDELIASTGLVERRWKWTGFGLATQTLTNLQTGKQWIGRPERLTDWVYNDITEARQGVVLNMKAEVVPAGFTCAEHINLQTQVFYPSAQATVLHQLDIYPDAPGLRSSLSIKQPRKRVAPIRTDKTKVKIKSMNGSSYYPDDFRDQVCETFATMLQGSYTLRFEISNIRQDKNYALGWSWWDWSGSGKLQSVTVSSADGKETAELQPVHLLPDFKNKREIPEQIVVDVPGDVLTSDRIVVEVKSAEGSTAISELWVYEYGAEPVIARSQLPWERAQQLLDKAPPGSTIAAFFDAGERASGRVQVDLSSGTAEKLNLPLRDMELHFAGFNAFTREFIASDEPILREETRKITGDTSARIDWANFAFLTAEDEALSLVKESNKCANLDSFDTGAFLVSSEEIVSTGWGVRAFEASRDDYAPGWANWVVLSDGGETGREMALKQFDRLIFPASRQGRYSAISTGRQSDINLSDPITIDSVKAVMATAAAEKIDLAIIEDGWQLKREKRLIGRDIWAPEEEYYPNGWKDVFTEMLANNMRTGLAADSSIGLEKMLRNFRGLHNSLFYVSGIKIRNSKELAEFFELGNGYVAGTAGTSRLGMEIGGDYPSAGYLLGRCFGTVRMPARDAAMQLSDIWQLARYINTDCFEIPVSGGAASMAFAFAGLPVLDKITEDEAQLDLLAVYRQIRDEISGMYVCPIGDAPDGKSWSGFQFCTANGEKGLFVVLREAGNEQQSSLMRLAQLPENITLVAVNLLTGEEEAMECSSGYVKFEMAEPGVEIFTYTK